MKKLEKSDKPYDDAQHFKKYIIRNYSWLGMWFDTW
jgi:hypothetical protein